MKSLNVLVVCLALLLQLMVHKMLKTRNEAIHKIETSEINRNKHEEFVQEITDIFRKLPKLQFLPVSDAAIFKRGQKRIKKFRLDTKENWVEGAQLVVDI
jgi:hypothetical protein